MKTRIQLRPDQGLKNKAVEVAREHRVTLSEVIREFLASYVSTPANLSSQPDVSVHGHDEVLSRLEAIDRDFKELVATTLDALCELREGQRESKRMLEDVHRLLAGRPGRLEKKERRLNQDGYKNRKFNLLLLFGRSRLVYFSPLEVEYSDNIRKDSLCIAKHPVPTINFRLV